MASDLVVLAAEAAAPTGGPRGMTEVRVFVVVEQPLGTLALRRYADRDMAACPSEQGYHDASVLVDEAWAIRRDDHGYLLQIDDGVPHDDPRWPLLCARCGLYRFGPADHWQVWQEPWYEGVSPDRGPVRATMRNLPPGALLRTPWLDGTAEAAGHPAGEGWGLVLPPEAPDMRGHIWHIYGPSSADRGRGPCWTITGDPREPAGLSAQPSIQSSDYHGFLTDEVLRDC